MTHLHKEDTRHVVDLLDSAIAVIEESVGFRDAQYWENCANSSVDTEIVFSEEEDIVESSATIFTTWDC